MFRRLFKFLFYLVALAVVVFILTAIWIMFDGLNDEGKRADLAVVPGHPEVDSGEPWSILKARMDRAIALYNDSQFPQIMVSGEPKDGGYDEADAMAKYLESQGVPAKVIILDREGPDTNEMVTHWADELKKMPETSTVMIVTHYYQMTRLKLALRLAGVDAKRIQHAHIGAIHKSDAYNIAREVVTFYDYLFRFYILPESKKITEKVTEEAKKGMEKAQEEANKAKESVDKKIENLPK